MRFVRLRYSSFRNLGCVDFEPAEGFNVLWGRNAQGKTNLLEGIYLLGHLKSFRTTTTQALIEREKRQAVIEAELDTNRVAHRLRLELHPQGKELTLDGKRPQRFSDVAETLRQVLFAPEEVMTVKGSPSLRRNLLDRSIFQLHPAYLERMQSYYRLIKQRNQLLRTHVNDAQLEVWNQGLIEEGARIRLARRRFMRQLEPHLHQCYQQLTGGEEQPQIRLDGASEEELAGQKKALAEELYRCRGQEIQRRVTLAGPHRDDPLFSISGLELKSHGSQGQQRTFVLAYKVALLYLLKEATGRTPVLMLDDITSELDDQRRQALFELLHNGAGQVFVTTTDPKLFMNSEERKSCFFEVREGQVYSSSTTTR